MELWVTSLLLLKKAQIAQQGSDIQPLKVVCAMAWEIQSSFQFTFHYFEYIFQKQMISGSDYVSWSPLFILNTC